MQITTQRTGELLEIRVEGTIDSASATDLRTAIEQAIGRGRHRILLDLAGVPFISSAGISMLVKSRSQMQAVHGKFGVCNPSPQVGEVLRMMRLDAMLLCDPEQFRATVERAGSLTRQSLSQVASEGGIDCEVYRILPDAQLQCRVVGSTEPLFAGRFVEDDCHPVPFPSSSFGLGLGAFGTRFADCRDRFGEFLAAAGGVAQLPTHGYATPDYLLGAEGFVPHVQMLCGVACTGGLANLLRFQPSQDSEAIRLSRFVDLALRLTKTELAGLVMLAECHGLVGAALRRSPVAAAAGSRFAHPEVREWVSFAGERVHRGSLALIVGVAARRPLRADAELLAPLLRPMTPDSDMEGHFHAAVFPFRPLKKRSLELVSSVRQLFDDGGLSDVGHLLCDSRPISGTGETELTGGACWISPIDTITSEDA
jgi:anti-anti-sigma factor